MAQHKVQLPYRNLGHLTLERRQFLSTLGSGVLLLAGCGGGSGGGGDTPLPAILQPNAVLLPADGSVSVTGRTATQLTLHGSVPPLAPGQVILSTMAEGFLLKVVGTTPDGSGGVVVQTEPATLEDAFKQADLRLKVDYDPATFTDLTPDDPDVQFVPPGRGRGRADDTSREFKIVLTKLVLAGTKDNGVTCEGSVTFKFNIDCQILIREGVLEAYRYVPTTLIRADFKVVVVKKLASSPGRVKLKTLVGPTLYIVALFGGIPVSIPYVPVLDIFFNREGKIEFGFEIPRIALTFQSGFTYTPARGVEPVTSHKVEMTALQFNQISAFKCAVGPGADLSLRLLGLAGPFLKCDGYADIELKRQSAPPGNSVKAGLGIKATVGSAVVVKDTTFLTREFPDLIEVRQNLFDKFYPDTTGVNVGVQ
ncbi:hypothetical protein [Armatimonas sp.]|uniref:hypothetical protein n=1 Tax=Armatimonas sp. TaxID=1872638 RepID=UPI00286D0B69|nr:hypothetical protein [Armatimonas sp.]